MVAVDNLAQNSTTHISTDAKAHFIFPVLMPGFTSVGTKIDKSADFRTSGLSFSNANTNAKVFDNSSKTIGQHLSKLGAHFDHNWKVRLAINTVFNS